MTEIRMEQITKSVHTEGISQSCDVALIGSVG